MSTENPTYVYDPAEDQDPDGVDGPGVVGPAPAAEARYSQGDQVPGAWTEAPARGLDDLPMIPLTAPNMPAPGKDFITVATGRGDPPAKKVTTGGRGPVCSSAGPELTRMHKAALYDPNFWITISTKHGVESVKFIPGHLWGSKEATGPRPAKVMMIGKWPGYYEGTTCRNFNYDAPGDLRNDKDGNSSRQLMAMLKNEFGPGRDPHLPAGGPLGYLNWYVVNAIRFPNPLEKRTDQKETRWLDMCLPMLQMDLRLVRPDFVLCLGTEATVAVLGKGRTVSNTYGRIFDLVVPLHTSLTDLARVHRAKVMTCIHPAVTLHKPEQTEAVIDGLRNFINLIQGNTCPAQLRPKDRRVVFRGWELEKLVEEAHADPDGDKIAVDCEWHGETPGEPNAYLRTIQFSYKRDQAACIVLHGEMDHPRNGSWLDADDQAVPRRCFAPGHGRCRELLHKLFYGRPDGKKVRVIGHNFKADLQWLIPWGLDLSDLFQAPLDDPDLDTNPDALPGWAKLATEGGFDTMLAHHSVNEVSDFKLEVICSRLLKVQRWDGDIQEFKKAWCAKRKIPEKNLEGYGPFPGDIGGGRGLYYYGMDDVDYGRQLFEEQSKEGGLLDSDRFGQPSWLPFWISMRANLAFLEMEMNGLAIDCQRVDALTDLYMTVRDQLQAKLRQMLNWSSFNHNSAQQCRALLFGPKFSGATDKKTGKYLNILKQSPKTKRFDETREVFHLRLTPIVTTGKPPQPWDKALRQSRGSSAPVPGTDKQSLGILRAQAAARHGAGSDEEDIVETLRRLRFVGQTLKSVLSEPVKANAKGKKIKVPVDDEDGEYEGGLIDFLQADGRVHTHLYQTKETGRASSSRPPLQNLSSKREADLERTVKEAGKTYDYPMRSVIRFHTDPWGEPVVGCEHDLAGAELLMMAVQSGDEKMIDHCQRNVLPDEGFDQHGASVPRGKFPHPNYYDIHSSIAVQAFKLLVEDAVDKKSGKRACEVLGLPVGAPLPPTKMALGLIGKSNLRKAAKTVVFGIPYGRGDEAIIRAVEEEGVQISMEEADQIRQAIFGMYPMLEPYLLACQQRVNTPGFIVNCFGRRRRFGYSYTKTTQGEAERQAGNFTIQGGVADYVSIALDKFYNYPGRFDSHGRPRYRLGLQIHDAVLAEVRVRDLEWWNEEVVPACMTRIPFYRCDLNGDRLSPQPYYMGCGRDIMRSWGVSLGREEGLALGVPERYLPSE